MATQSAVIHNDPIACDELLRRCVGNATLLHRVLKKFVVQVAVDVDSLAAAIVRKDLTETSRLAHKVRGTSLSVSALEMSRIAREIELRAEATDAVELAALAENLSIEQIRVAEFVDSLCIAAKDA